MRCPVCDSPSPASARFCARCGATLEPLRASLAPAACASVAQSADGRPPAALPAPELVAGRYRLARELGCGGFGAVFEASDTRRGGRRVALKRLLPARLAEPSAQARFEEEIRALAALRHPGIVRFLDSGQDGGAPFLVTEFVAGMDLRRRMRRARDEDPARADREALDLMGQILEALGHAHCRTAHLDLKPENILVRGDGTAVLLDFGLARISDFRAQGRRCLGSAYYVAPEVLAGEDVVGYKADVYSLGIVFYEMLMGSLPVGLCPWPGGRFPEGGAELDRILARALDPSPAHRFRNVFDLQAALERAFPEGAGPEEDLARAARRARGGDPESLLRLGALLEAAGRPGDAQGRYKAAAQAGRGTPAEAMARECLGYPRKKAIRFCILCGAPLPPEARRSTLCPDCWKGTRAKPGPPARPEEGEAALLRGPRGGATLLRFSSAGALLAAGEGGDALLASAGSPSGGDGARGAAEPREWSARARRPLPGMRDAAWADGETPRVLAASREALFLLEARESGIRTEWLGNPGAALHPPSAPAELRQPSACGFAGAGAAVAGDRSGLVYRFEFGGGAAEGEPRVLWRHAARVLAVCALEDGRIASVAADGSWRIGTEEGESARGTAGMRLSSASIARRAAVAAAVSEGRALRFALEPAGRTRILQDEGRTTAAAAESGGRWVAAGDERGEVALFGESGSRAGGFRLDRNPVCALEVSPDGAWLAASTLGGGVWIIPTEGILREGGRENRE